MRACHSSVPLTLTPSVISFAGSRECKLLDDVCAAFKDGNVDAFTDAVYSYDQISKLDPWKTSVLLKVKNSIQKASGQGDDLT